MLALIVFAVWVLILSIRDRRNQERVKSSFIYFLPMVLCVMLMMMFGAMGNLFPATSLNSSTPIYSLKTSEGVQAQFMLGSGSVNSNPVYLCYTKNDIGYSLKEVDASKSIIIQTNDTPPRMDTYKLNLVWEILLFADNSEYRIYIPENSIIQTYNPNP